MRTALYACEQPDLIILTGRSALYACEQSITISEVSIAISQDSPVACHVAGFLLTASCLLGFHAFRGLHRLLACRGFQCLQLRFHLLDDHCLFYNGRLVFPDLLALAIVRFLKSRKQRHGVQETQ